MTKVRELNWRGGGGAGRQKQGERGRQAGKDRERERERERERLVVERRMERENLRVGGKALTVGYCPTDGPSRRVSWSVGTSRNSVSLAWAPCEGT